MHNLALPIFTLFVQSAIGFAFALLIMRQYKQAGQSANLVPFGIKSIFSNKETVALFAICALIFLGLLASMTHLGYLANAMYSISHFQSSWLSREIILSSACLAILGVTFLSQWIKGSYPVVLLVIAILIGIADVYSMATIYTSTPVVTWDFSHTYTSFFGVVITSVCFAVILTSEQHPKLQKISLFVLIVSLIIRAFSQVELLMLLPEKVEQLGILFPSQAQVPFYTHLGWLICAWIMAAVSIFAISHVVLNKSENKTKWIILSILCIILFEGVGRYLFYTIR